MKRKFIAVILVLAILSEICVPTISYALTDGPSLPEAGGFAPVDNSNLVNVFSGDFNYSIPLLDVGGYPLTLSYQSGPGMEQEASWVGLGWNLNPGSITRSLRGVPDDFNNDLVKKEMNLKKNFTVGFEGGGDMEIFGLRLPATFSGGLFYNSYKGFGLSAGANFTKSGGGQGKSKFTAGIGISLNTQDGMDINPELAFERVSERALNSSGTLTSTTRFNSSLSGSFSSRAGMKEINFSADRAKSKTWIRIDPSGNKPPQVFTKHNRPRSISGHITFADPGYAPSISTPMLNEYYAMSIGLGPTAIGLQGKINLKGFYQSSSLLKPEMEVPAFGYLNEEDKGKEEKVMLDMSREKDGMITRDVKYLGIPNHLYDLFNMSGEGIGGQFRSFRNDAGLLHDQKTNSGNINGSTGIDFGAGAYAKFGINFSTTLALSTSQKWKILNKLKRSADFRSSGDHDNYETSYFKLVTEQTGGDVNYRNTIDGTRMVAPMLSGTFAAVTVQDKLNSYKNAFTSPTIKYISHNLQRTNNRAARGTVIAMNTIREKNSMGLGHYVHSLPENVFTDASGYFLTTSGYLPAPLSDKPGHHIGEFTVVKPDGKTYYYGVPVYNNFQREVTFSVDKPSVTPPTGIVTYGASDNTKGNEKGMEHFFSAQTTPQYAHSYMLSSVVSPDYQDRNGDGPSNDDIGTWVRFNYSKTTSDFKWRMPVGENTATYNPGFRSIDTDDKASYVYGSKELWYLHSIESREFVAVFLVDERDDGLGVTGEAGVRSPQRDNGQRRLEEIRLYAKSDIQNHGFDNAVPIKTVHFEYETGAGGNGYDLCKGIYNNVNYNGVAAPNTGKLTLRRVYFTYGNNTKGVFNKYEFEYSNVNPNYSPEAVDRWGNYKRTTGSLNPNGVSNKDYPYTSTNRAMADLDAMAWNLVKLTLPTGGTIQINYEADDYAFVQNQRACQMFTILGFGKNQGASFTGDLYQSKSDQNNYIFLNLPYPVADNVELGARYIDGLKYMYFKSSVVLANGKSDYVEGYADILDYGLVSGSNSKMWIRLGAEDGLNPITKAALTMLRNDLQAVAYPNSINQNADPIKLIKALLGVLGEIGNLVIGYENTAVLKGWAKNASTTKTWVKLRSPELMRPGGGSRVKSIVSSDDWSNLSQTSGLTAPWDKEKSQLSETKYDYTTEYTLNGQKILISSGVASYEPVAGGEENVFRKPIYIPSRKNPLTPNDNRFIEEPLCESYFPAPSVGYSEVKIMNVDPVDHSTPLNEGYMIKKFYTAKDFPTIVSRSSVNPIKSPPKSLLSLLWKKFTFESVAASQGYYVELNDMHGKAKSDYTFGAGNRVVSGTEFKYKEKMHYTGVRQLDNEVNCVLNNTRVISTTMGEDIDLFFDTRHNSTKQISLGLEINVDVTAPFAISVPSGFPVPKIDLVNVKSGVAMKVVNKSGIISQTESYRDGAKVVEEVLAYDFYSGAPVVTTRNDEFGNHNFDVTQPAYWYHTQMGSSSTNIGYKFTVDPTLSTVTTPGTYILDLNIPHAQSYLFHGDEVIPASAEDEISMIDYLSLNGLSVSNLRFWISSPPCPGTSRMVLMTDRGDVIKGYDSNHSKNGLQNIVRFKVVRSGRKNQLSDPMAAYNFNGVVTNVIKQVNNVNYLNLLQHNMLSMTGTEYADSWKMDAAGNHTMTGTAQLTEWDCLEDFVRGLILTLQSPTIPPHWLYTNIPTTTIGQILDANTPNPCTSNLLAGHNVDSVYFDVIGYPRDKNLYYARVGDNCYIRFSSLFTFNMEELDSGSINPPATNKLVHVTLHPPDRVVDVELICAECNYQCEDYANGDLFNPIREGVSNRWYPEKSYVFNTARNVSATQLVKESGYFNYQQSDLLYYYSNAVPPYVWNKQVVNSKWIPSSIINYRDRRGRELETKDPLNLYASALYSNKGDAPAAVFKNAKYEEIYFNSFEEFFYRTGRDNENCMYRRWSTELAMTGGAQQSLASAHAGVACLKIPSGAEARFIAMPPASVPIGCNYDYYDNRGEYEFDRSQTTVPLITLAPGKKYLISVWARPENDVCDITDYSDLVSPLSVGEVKITPISGSTTVLPFVAKTPEIIIDGWQLYQAEIDVPASYSNISVNFGDDTRTILIDDFRLMPFNAEGNCYVYNPFNLRLMAKLDANHYAAFYEYDEEGNLIRTKKETERGVMTIQEDRKNVRKKN